MLEVAPMLNVLHGLSELVDDQSEKADTQVA